MKLVKTTGIFIVALLVNYSSGWTYGKGKESRVPAKDSVIVPASYRYAKLNPLKWFFLGDNYRKEWSTPVAMPVFHLATTRGGFVIEKLGGGQQTRKVHLVNLKDSSEWELRSVDKFVTDEALPPGLRKSFMKSTVKSIIQDQISAAYPYGLMTINDLSTAVGIPSAPADLYYVPDDPDFGQYRPAFAHTVCFLIPKTIGGQDLDTEDTDTIRALLEKDSRYSVMQRKLLNVRLFDMLIADWDRHKKQWEWAMTDSAGRVYVYAIGEDRDQAYFRSQGALPFFVRTFGVPHLIGFRHSSDKLVKLNNKAHEFDSYFLNSLTREDWESAIKEFQSRLTDEVIHKAVKRMPAEIYAISGAEVEEKLRSRRDGLLQHGLEYYRFLAANVTVTGSEAPEKYTVRSRGKDLEVSVSRQADNLPVFSRVFNPDETKEVRLLNLDKNDKIDTTGAAGSGIGLKLEERKPAINP